MTRSDLSVPLLAIFALLITSSGCKTTITDTRGREAVVTPEVALIRGQGNNSWVERINDRTVDNQHSRKFVIPPGEVTAYITATGGDVGGVGGGGGGASAGVGMRPGSHNITFNARAGHEYEMGYQTIWIGRKPYLRDVTAKKDLVEYKIDGEWAYPGEKDAPAPAAK